METQIVCVYPSGSNGFRQLKYDFWNLFDKELNEANEIVQRLNGVNKIVPI